MRRVTERNHGGLRERILAALAIRPMHIRDLCAAVNRDYFALPDIIKHMRETGKLITVGTAGEQGYTNVRKDAPIYALPGTKQLKPKAAQAVHARRKASHVDEQIAIAQPITIGRGTALWPSNRSRAS